MLKRTNRVVKADDFRATVRRGKRVGTPYALLYVAKTPSEAPTRFGFIVAKTVGNAVHRNLVTRRLRSIASEFLSRRPTGMDVVIRALPGSPGVPWITLQSEILAGLERSAV